MFNLLSPNYIRNCRLVFIDPPADPPGGGAPPAKANFVDDKGKTWGFPVETPEKNMTFEQQTAYWKYHAKKHERLRRPDDYEQTLADAQSWRTRPPAGAGNGEPVDAAAAAASTAAAKTEGVAEGRTEGIKATLPTLLELAIRSKNPEIEDDDVESIIDDLDLNKFVTQGGEIDNARVQKLAEKHAATASTSATPGVSGDPLANALGHNQQQPGGSSTAGGSIAALRQQERDRLAPKKS